MVQIIPAILATSEEEYKQKIEKLQSIKSIKDSWIQIDLMDNKFVQNSSIGLDIIAKYPTSFKIEAQLMVQYPDSWIDGLVNTGVERIIFPLEHTQVIDEKIEHIKKHNINEVGLSLNPETAVEQVYDYLPNLDAVLIMSVHPGFSGQQFIPEVLSKVGKIKSIRPDILIGMDGGISEKNAKQVVEAGVDYLVVGSGIFKYDNVEEGIKKIQKSIYDM